MVTAKRYLKFKWFPPPTSGNAKAEIYTRA